MTSRVWRTATALALGATVIGAARAAWRILPRTWVLEFQAGLPSSGVEKFNAIVQSTAIEGFGFLIVGVFLGVVALLLAKVLARWQTESEGGFASAWLLCLGAFFGFNELAWMAQDALDFLTRAEVLLLDALGFLALLAGLLLFDYLVRRCPWSVRARAVTAAATLAGAALAGWAALWVLRNTKVSGRDPTFLLLAGLCALAAIPLAALATRVLALPVNAVCSRLSQGPFMPARVTLALWLMLLACGGWTLAHLQFSPMTATPSYSRVPARPDVEGPNVVFVTVDTLRADHLGCYGYPRSTSPTIDTLAAEGARCADASASASWTKPATGTILTGLHPSRHGALYHGSMLHLPEGKQSLAEAFQKRGYVTAGFVANPNIKRVFGFDRGFDEYFDAPVEDTVTLASLRSTWLGGILMTLLRHQFNWNYENDIASMNAQVTAWLGTNHAARFFLYVHYIDPHIPYDPPARYREEFGQDHGWSFFNERKRKVGIDLYDGEIRYTDDGIAALVARLRELGVWDNTLLVLTSDHGEEFFEHGVLGHGFSLYQEVMHVPLIVRGPGVPAGTVVTEPVAVLDLAATVLDLAGADIVEFGDGRSFAERIQSGGGTAQGTGELRLQFFESEFGQTDDNHREFVFTGLRSGSWKLVLTEANKFFPPSDAGFGREALYDLERDPSESKNLFYDELQKERVRALLEDLIEHSKFLAEQGSRDMPPAALTPELEAQLRALGYIGGN